MKILILAAANSIHSVRWCNQLSSNGNEIHLCYLSNHKPNIDVFDSNVTLHKLKFPSPTGYYSNVLQLKKIIFQLKPDIVHAHYASGYATLGRLLGFSPYLISVYGSDVYEFPYKNKLNMDIIKKNLMSANAIASTSKAMAKQTIKLVNIPISDIHITPFGVDIDKFSNKNLRKAKNRIIIGTIKTLETKYGIKYGILAIDYLINHLMKSNPNNLDIKYIIYGEGTEKEYLKKLVEKKNLSHIVKFKNRIPNHLVPEKLNKFDIFLGTSINESFGVAIVEAMACEIPVIVTDADGFKEVVDNGNAGIMVKRKDYKSMARKIYNLIQNPQYRKELGIKQRDHIIKNYNWLDNVKEIEKVYSYMTSKDHTIYTNS